MTSPLFHTLATTLPSSTILPSIALVSVVTCFVVAISAIRLVLVLILGAGANQSRIFVASRYVAILAIGIGFLSFVLPPTTDSILCRSLANYTQMETNRQRSDWSQIQQFHNSLPFVSDLHSDALMWTHRGKTLLERSVFGHVDVPRLREGNVALQVLATVTKVPITMNVDINKNTTLNVFSLLSFAQGWPISSISSLTHRVLYQAQRLQRTADLSSGTVLFIKSKSDLNVLIEKRAYDKSIVGSLLAIEGAHALDLNLENLDTLVDAGVRIIGLNHFTDNEFSGSQHGEEKYGLTNIGRQLVQMIMERQLIIDLAHASTKTMDDVLAMTLNTANPVGLMVSHSGVKGSCNNNRNLDDYYIKEIAKRGGIIGIGLWPTALCGRDMSYVVKAIEYIANLLGDVNSIALGSDWDGSVAVVVEPQNMVHLTAQLLDAGFTREQVAKIMGQNVQQFLLKFLA